MIPFRKPQLSDKAWVDPIFARAGLCAADYNFSVLYTWAVPFEHEIAEWGGFLVKRLPHCPGGHSYLWPVGEGDLRGVLDALAEDAASFGMPLRMICLTEAHVELLHTQFPGEFVTDRDRGGDDYIYDIDRMADLLGKKLHQKRNHVNRFMEAHPLWTCESVTPSNIGACLAMDEAWRRLRHGDAAGTLQAEDTALRTALRDFSGLGLDGVLLRAEGEVVAFALGDLVTSTCYAVHFEKAFGEVQGAYPMIARQFARWVRGNYPSVRWINREDDMNLEGLRRAKRSFGPDWMLEKYTAVRQ